MLEYEDHQCLFLSFFELLNISKLLIVFQVLLDFHYLFLILLFYLFLNIITSFFWLLLYILNRIFKHFSCIISLIIPLFLFIYNLYRILNKEKIFEGFKEERLYRKIFALFIGYRTKGIKKRFAIPIEDGFGKEENSSLLLY